MNTTRSLTIATGTLALLAAISLSLVGVAPAPAEAQARPGQAVLGAVKPTAVVRSILI